MKRYKAFVRQAELPLITVTTNGSLQVGGVVKMDATRLAQLSAPEKEVLAGQFQFRSGSSINWWSVLARNPPPAADQLAQELRTAVIDYRFLQIEWDRYHPPAEGQKTKSDALAALQAGDISKAWELYDGLRRPRAPAIAAPPRPPTFESSSTVNG